MGLQFLEGYMLVNRDTVVDDMKVVLIEVDDPVTFRVLNESTLNVPLFRHDPVIADCI
jgi:hypothetical protein